MNEGSQPSTLVIPERTPASEVFGPAPHSATLSGMSSLTEKLAAFDPNLPLAAARTIPATWYSDPEVFELERRAVFNASWQVVGRTEQVSDPGQFVTAEIAGTPVVAVRNDAGELGAFINVCRHRAARVATEPAGTESRLRCRYHGWTYDLRGQLRGTPEFDGVANFRREDNGLVPLAVDVWGPTVWARIAQGDQSLSEFLTPLPEQMAPLGLEQLKWAERREYDLACNWKVYVDNFLDGGYHVNTIHPGLAGALDYSQYRTEIAGNTSVQISPLKPPDAIRDPAVGKVRTGGMAYYWWVFPNFMVNVYGGIMDTNLVLPLGPDRCRVIFDFYFRVTEGPAARQFIADSIAVAEQVQQEDMAICEDVQRGLASGAFETGRFSVRREAAGHHFHVLLARRLQSFTRELTTC
jgi:phenylpropionate dioxygenase-like ring-hydroxylating dioxygenase large terminal subunit